MGNQLTLSPDALKTTNVYLKEDSIDDVQQIFDKLKKKQNNASHHAIDRKTFGDYFRYDTTVTDKIFQEFDSDNNGTIDSDEFLRGMALNASGNLDSKIKFCFNAYDSSGDGKLQKTELEGLLLSTTFSSFALLEAVGRSMDMTAQHIKVQGNQSPDRPLERLLKKAAFKNEVDWMVTEAYKNSDKNDDNSLDYEEFFAWVVNSPQVMEVLYGTFQLRREAATSSSSIEGDADPSRNSNSLFRSSSSPTSASLTNQVPASTATPPNTTDTQATTPATTLIGSETAESTQESSTSASQLVNQQSDAGRLRNIWRYWGNVTFVVSMFGLVCMVVERLILHHAYNDTPNAFTSTFRYIVSVDCVLLVCCLIRWTHVKVQLQKVKGHINSMATICSTPYVRRRLCLDIIVALIHVPPHAMEELHDSAGLQYWLTNALSWLMLLRIYLLPNMLQQYFVQKYVTLQQEFMARLSNVQFSVLFTLRAELRMQPFRLVFGSLAITVIITTFLLEEAELGLGCMYAFANVSNSTNLTLVSSHAGGFGGAGDASDWHWLYQDKCHVHPALPGFGWFYYALNLVLQVAPRRIPMTPTGEGFNTVAGGVSLVIFAITVAAVQNTLQPTLSEQRVLQVIREERVRVEIRRAAISLIQRSWYVFMFLFRRTIDLRFFL